MDPGIRRNAKVMQSELLDKIDVVLMDTLECSKDLRMELKKYFVEIGEINGGDMNKLTKSDVVRYLLFK